MSQLEGSSTTAVRSTGLTKDYGPGAGLFDLDLEIPAARILGLIGPSGSGKTTAVRLLTGLIAPDAGEVEVLGQRPTSFGNDTRGRIGYLPQDSVFYPTLTIRENIDFAAAIQGLGRRQRRDRVGRMLDLVELSDWGDRRLADASGGMKRRTGLAAALVHGPDLVFLDEPTAGLDPILRQSLWAEFRSLSDEGTTMVVTTQHVGEAASCDEIVLLSDGAVAAHGAPEDIRRQAFGGELLQARFDKAVAEADIATMADAIAATSYEGLGIGRVRFTVPDAGTATADLPAAAEGCGLSIVAAERVTPDFDDVFARIVGAHREDAEVGA